MSIWRPDPSFYPSPKMAMEAPAEKLASVAMVNGKNDGRLDALEFNQQRYRLPEFSGIRMLSPDGGNSSFSREGHGFGLGLGRFALSAQYIPAQSWSNSTAMVTKIIFPRPVFSN